MSFPRTIIAFAIRAFQVALPLVGGYFLSRTLPLGLAMLGALAISALLPALGALLLTTLRTQEVGWKNYAAGWLLPWGYTLGRGKLLGIALACGTCWLFLFAVGIAAERLATPGADSTEISAEAPALARWFLVGGWLVNGIALLYLFGTLRKNFTLRSSEGRSLMKVIAFVLGLIGGSIALAFLGFPRAAAAVSAGPALLLGAFYAVWIGFLLTLGRNARWN
jgi:hypothetical protein